MTRGLGEITGGFGEMTGGFGGRGLSGDAPFSDELELELELELGEPNPAFFVRPETFTTLISTGLRQCDSEGFASV